MKEKIRPVYLELQGYLNQLSQLGDKSSIRTRATWDNYHSAISELNSIAGCNYDKFKLLIDVSPGNFGQSYNYVDLTNFKFQLGGLIMKLYGKYFFEERNPLDGTPSTVINTTQNQSQSVQLEIVFEMTELITQKLDKYNKDTPERNFLEQVKEGVKAGKSITELINFILTTGTNLGLTAATILQLLSK